MTVSRKDCIAIAQILKRCRHGVSTASQTKLAEELCELFLFYNEKFDSEKFLEACGLSKINKWTNLSYANVATTSPKAHLIASEWAESLARGGAAEFDAEAEKKGMMPLRKATSNRLGCPVSDVCVSSSATEILCSLA